MAFTCGSTGFGRVLQSPFLHTEAELELPLGKGRGSVLAVSCLHSANPPGQHGISPLTLHVYRGLCLCRKSRNLKDAVAESRFKSCSLSILLYIFGFVAGVNLCGGGDFYFFLSICFRLFCGIFVL